MGAREEGRESSGGQGDGIGQYGTGAVRQMLQAVEGRTTISRKNREARKHQVRIQGLRRKMPERIKKRSLSLGEASPHR